MVRSGFSRNEAASDAPGTPVGRTLLHVAESGGRGRGGDAQGDQGTGPIGQAVVGGPQRVGEPLHRADHVVGRHDRQLGIGVDIGHQRGGQAHRVGGVPGDRFQDQAVGAQLGQRRPDHVAVPGGRAHPDLLGGQHRLQPGEGLGQQAVRAPVRVGDDVQELLGPGGPGQRPQPRPGTAGHDHCVPHGVPLVRGRVVGCAPSGSAQRLVEVLLGLRPGADPAAHVGDAAGGRPGPHGGPSAMAACRRRGYCPDR